MAVTRNFWPRRTGREGRTFHCSPCTRAQPSVSKSPSASPTAPIISSRPLTTLRPRLRAIMPTMKMRNPALAADLAVRTGRYVRLASVWPGTDPRPLAQRG